MIDSEQEQIHLKAAAYSALLTKSMGQINKYWHFTAIYWTRGRQFNCGHHFNHTISSAFTLSTPICLQFNIKLNATQSVALNRIEIQFILANVRRLTDCEI